MTASVRRPFVLPWNSVNDLVNGFFHDKRYGFDGLSADFQ